jgi:LGFP repeat
MGFERSTLGYPVSDEMDRPGWRRSRFERGEIRWTPPGGPKVIPIHGFGDDLELVQPKLRTVTGTGDTL